MPFPSWSQNTKYVVVGLLVLTFIWSIVSSGGWIHTASTSVPEEQYLSCEEQLALKNSLLIDSNQKISELNASLRELKFEKWGCDSDLSDCESILFNLNESYISCMNSKNVLATRLSQCDSDLETCNNNLLEKSDSGSILPLPYEGRAYYTNFLFVFTILFSFGFVINFNFNFEDKRLSKMFTAFSGSFSILMMLFGYFEFITGFWPKFTLSLVLAFIIGYLYIEKSEQ